MSLHSPNADGSQHETPASQGSTGSPTERSATPAQPLTSQPEGSAWNSSRRSVVRGLAILVLGAVGGMGGTALVEGLGWENLGPLATWVAAGLTLAAVMVALQSSQRSVQATEEARQRAEDDRRFAINRQSALAVADMWAALLAIRPVFEAAAEALRHPRWVGPNESLDPNPKVPVQQAITAASAAVFFARSVIEEGPVLDLVDKLHGLFAEFQSKWNSPTTGDLSTQEWLSSVNLALAEIETYERLTVDLARHYLPMSLTQAERIEREAEAIAFERGTWTYLQSKRWGLDRIYHEHTWGKDPRNDTD